MVEAKLNFFLIGAPKAGTTLVYDRLSRHPQVFLSPLKEPNHYSTDIDPSNFSTAFRGNTKLDTAAYLSNKPLETRQVGFVQDAGQYAALFEGAGQGHIAVGECSTSYLWSKDAAMRVAEAHPDARILAVLRNPVERLHSHWLMARMYGFTDLDLMAAVEHDRAHPHPGWGQSELFVEAGMYADQLGRWLRQFPRAQVKVLLNEQLSDPKTWEELKQWMGLESSIPEVDGNRSNPAGRARMEGLNHWVTRFGMKGAMERLIPRPMKQGLKRIWYTNEGLPGLSDADRRVLWTHFESDVEALEKLLDIDLSHWRP